MFGHAQDIIDNPDIHLDEMFIASLVFDLIKVSVRNADLLNVDVVYIQSKLITFLFHKSFFP